MWCLLGIFHGTFWCHIQYKEPVFQWSETFSCGHKLECRTYCLSFPKCLGISKSVFHPPGNRGDRSIVSFCWLHCGHSSHWPKYQIHLKICEKLFWIYLSFWRILCLILMQFWFNSKDQFYCFKHRNQSFKRLKKLLRSCF